MDNCIFCKIIKNEIPSTKVYEDKQCIVILDISQLTYGHCLVICKKHYANLIEIPATTLTHCIKVAQKVAQSMMYIKGIKGVNIVNNCNEVAGQSVMHFHIHVLPRYEKDEFIMEARKENKVDSKQLNKIAEKIKTGLN